MIGRVKESTTNLRNLHRVMCKHYDPLMHMDSDYAFFLTGDLKYLASTNGHSGCDSTFPCQCCVRKRKYLVSE